MPVELDSLAIISYLQKFLNNNKARGMAAELNLKHDLALLNQPIAQKLLRGAWIISPRSQYHLRYCAFVMPELYETLEELEAAIHALENDRAWQTLVTFLSLNHIGTIVSGAIFHLEAFGLEKLFWKTFTYERERLVPRSNHEPFTLWNSRRGRASSGKEWSENVLTRYESAELKDLTELALRQAFLEGYLKSELGKSLGETYDIDAFIVAFSGKVIPLEIKEKTSKGEFGVDAGRILMLLRLGLMTDSNALYLIREVDESENRHLVKWMYISLADLIMKCRWNLQAGGIGMGGGSTQTIMTPASFFQEFTAENLSEKWLNAHGGLQDSVKSIGIEVAHQLQTYITIGG
jgi:hypothetical protein